MKLCVYTSCSINYLPKARVLAESLKTHHPTAEIILCLNDVLPTWLRISEEPFDQVWQPSDLNFSRGWIFNHNVMEICTAVKGRALVKILEEITADLYLYFDPDVFIYGDLSPIAMYMGNSEIGLVPHITKPELTEIGVELTELSVVAHGTYNLGHLIIKDGKISRAFAAWWDQRLTKYCYDDKEYGLFTDQRWCDLVPALFDKVSILRQPNLDVASWNVFGRAMEINAPGSQYAYNIDGYPLLTYHFSGTGPTGTHRRIREIFAPSNAAVAEIERDYEIAISNRGQNDFEKIQYGGDFYENGVPVSPRARHIYRKNVDLQNAFLNPFSVGEKSYYQWLSENYPTLHSFITLKSFQIDNSFSEIFDAEFYLDRYPDVGNLINQGKYRDALDHYVKVGSSLLCDPNALFVSSYYFERAHKTNGASLRKFASPQKENTLLWHYLSIGISSGIEPIEYFNSVEYLNANADVALAFKLLAVNSPFAHFVNYGDREMRKFSGHIDLNSFSEKSLEARRLMKQKNIGPFAAFALLGGVEGRVYI